MSSLSRSSRAASAAEEVEKGFIDGHVHVWTPDTQKYPLAAGAKKADMQPPSFTPEELFSHCKPCGVTRIILIQMSFYGTDNSYMLDMMATYPGVFSGVAVIDENDKPAETMRKLVDKGVRGFRIRPAELKEDEWLAGEGMAAMWRCGAETGQAMCCLIDAKYLPSVAAMCRKFPDTPVVIDHLARIGVDGQIRDADVANLCALAKHKQAHVKISAFYALGKKKPPYTDLALMIRRVLDAFGPERCLWASDAPFQVTSGNEYRPSIELIKDRLDFLTGDDRQWLLRKTAERVFFA